MEQPKLTKDLFRIKLNTGLDYKWITDFCIEHENHPMFAHDEDGTSTPNQFSENLRSYVRGAKEGKDFGEDGQHDMEESSKEIEFYSTYNPFQFGHRPFADLYWKLNEFFYSDEQVHLAGEPYYIHGWFNVYTKKDDENRGYDHIPWHKHLEIYHPHIYHGFYCANVQPSQTWYREGPESPEEEWVKHVDYDDMIIYSPSSYEHSSTPWLEDKPRVTIAFDIIPESVYCSGHEVGNYQWSLDPRQYQAVPFPKCI